ncbi:MAG: COG1355, Predicted dioxygenase, partial [uncultured Gemmatimonadetes bacterium]
NYQDLLPRPDDCILLIEVAESSLEFDTSGMARRYAIAGIPEYWVLDILHARVLVHRRPEAGSYREVVAHPGGASFISPALGGGAIRVDDILVA